MSKRNGVFLVFGASGNVGREVVAELHQQGHAVRGVTRDPGAATPVGDGVEMVAGDLNDPSSVYDALDGVVAIFLLPGYDGTGDLLARAGAQGVRRAVLLSGGSAGSGDTSNAVTRYMMSSEAAVRDSGLSWTFLRPSAFMSNAVRWRAQLQSGDVVRLPFAGVRTALVDPADIAAVAVRGLVDDGYAEQILQPSGPESLLPAEQVAILGDSLGRPLRFEAQPDDEARAEMLKSTPSEYVDAFFDFYADGSLDESQVTGTVQDVTGRPPRRFADWVAAHAAEFDT